MGHLLSQSNAGGNAVDVAVLEATVSRWRLATAIAATVAAALFAVAVGDRMLPSANPHTFVAVLTPSNAAPAFVATVNLDSPTLVIRRLADPPPADRNYVLWAAPANGPPQALGVLDQSRNTFPFDLTGDVALEVSVEAKGAPTPPGPTGPIAFSGRLLEGT
jgi:anti-sigma-K factor RskA